METKVNKEILHLFFAKLAKLFNSFFPGMVILELFFNKGYFSTPPDNIFSFFLFVIWCGIFSVPYHFIQPFSIENFRDNLLKLVCEKFEVSKLDFEKNMDKETEEKWDDIMEEFTLGFILVKLACTYVIFKYLLAISFPSIIILGMPIMIIQLIITLFLVILVSYPVGYIYSKIFLFLVKKYYLTK